MTTQQADRVQSPLEVPERWDAPAAQPAPALGRLVAGIRGVLRQRGTWRRWRGDWPSTSVPTCRRPQLCSRLTELPRGT